MESKKIKELKEDAILEVKVNKTYYQMCKASLFTVFKDLYDKSGDPDKFVKNIVSKDYKDMTDHERLFYTLSLLVGEIEKQGLEQKAFVDKELNVEDLKNELEALKSNED
jgi:hypothetical protein